MNSNFFKGNRKSLAKKIGSGLIVIAANVNMQRSADEAFTFRQDSNFYYLTGINVAAGILCIDIDNDEEFLIMPKRDDIAVIFEGEIDIEAVKKQSGIELIMSDGNGWNYIKSRKPSKINTIIPDRSIDGDFAVNPFRRHVAARLKRIFGKQLVADCRKELAVLRQIKQPLEIKYIERAATITYEALENVTERITEFENELQIEAEINYYFGKNGIKHHAYKPIIASGTASCTLHYTQNNQELKKGSPILFDVGAEYANYASDISRTVICGLATSRQKDIIEAVAEIQKKVADYITPGLSWRDVSDFSVNETGKKLKDLGLISDIADHTKIRKFFPHSISHFVGLDVHDAGDYTSHLQEGMVITIEPGIYISDEALGVRIEDDYLITKSGVRKLGKSLPAVI
jgi:Xaa-Pro aminopeptidase